MSSQGAGSAARSGKAASTSASTSTPTQHDDVKDREYEQAQSKKELLMQQHWLKWLPDAEKESSVVLVFDKSPDAIKADIKRMAGANTKTTTVERVVGIYDSIEEGKNLGTVEAGLVTVGAYGAIKDKYKVQSITVKFNNQERIAYIPVEARSH
ncbi:uncharacterized protein B0T15DRAFT_530100 [Chaetomium strumarium]|uniref:Uncharacterized protein n=1 Tax=Chaetomium strumarium TaxID=1170767 RepID=A0AAJ0GX04_9PEZI|nr:hypothetical protein B0T15DRAFT_530100 [Chaetomium strumarium]